eukprot:725508-Rhodomonas_salina.1
MTFCTVTHTSFQGSRVETCRLIIKDRGSGVGGGGLRVEEGGWRVDIRGSGLRSDCLGSTVQGRGSRLEGQGSRRVEGRQSGAVIERRM